MQISIDIQAIGGAIIFSAAVAAALAYFWRIWGRPTQQWFRELDRTVRTVDEQLKINGCDDELPLELRGLPLRTLVVKHIVAAAPAIEASLNAAAALLKKEE